MFHGGTFVTKVMASLVPYPPSFFLYFSLLYRFVNVQCFLHVPCLRFHAWKLGFRRGTSISNVMVSSFPPPPLFLYYFVFPFKLAYWCLLLFCCCRFNGERRRKKGYWGVCLIWRFGSWMWLEEGPCIPIRRSRLKS